MLAERSVQDVCSKLCPYLGGETERGGDLETLRAGDLLPLRAWLLDLETDLEADL